MEYFQFKIGQFLTELDKRGNEVDDYIKVSPLNAN